MGHVVDLDVELIQPPAPVVSVRFPAALLWAEEATSAPVDASEAALRNLRAEALKAIERVEAATEASA